MYDYIKSAYEFQPEVGRRVLHTVTNNAGVIKREGAGMSHYVMVLFDGKKYALPCHPGELVYVTEPVS